MDDFKKQNSVILQQLYHLCEKYGDCQDEQGKLLECDLQAVAD